MIVTSPYKTPPTAPVDVAVGARAGLTTHYGRNTGAGKVNLPLSND